MLKKKAPSQTQTHLKKFKIKHNMLSSKNLKKNLYIYIYISIPTNTFSHHRPSCKKKSSNGFWIFHYFLGSINKDIITTLEISKPIDNKKPKNSQKLIKNLRDPQNKVDSRQGIDQNTTNGIKHNSIFSSITNPIIVAPFTNLNKIN